VGRKKKDEEVNEEDLKVYVKKKMVFEREKSRHTLLLL